MSLIRIGVSEGAYHNVQLGNTVKRKPREQKHWAHKQWLHLDGRNLISPPLSVSLNCL